MAKEQDPIDRAIAEAKERIARDNALIADLEAVKRVKAAQPGLLGPWESPQKQRADTAASRKAIAYGSKKKTILQVVSIGGHTGLPIGEVVAGAQAKGMTPATTEGISPKLSFYKSEAGGGLVDLKNGRWTITSAGVKWIAANEQKGPDHAA